jgi:hypothetical protein
MSGGLKASRKSEERKGIKVKRYGDATFKNPRRKRIAKMIVSHQEPQTKTDLRLKRVNAGPVHIPEIPPEDQTKHIARLVPVEDQAECQSYTRYGNKRGAQCDCKPGSHMSAHDKRRYSMFGGSTMIAGR